VAIVRTTGQRCQVLEVCERGEKSGIKPGMSAAESRALCANLVCIEDDPAANQRALEALGRWLTRFTPVVGRGWEESDAPQPPALFLDLTGCERLFGGIPRLVELIRQSLDRFTIAAHMAVAPTIGAAWAFAVTGSRAPCIIDASSLSNAIRPLPVFTLRLDETILIDLHHVGLVRVGHLLALPRDQFPSRFGPTLLKRLDQLTGAVAEPLAGLVNDPPISARADFDAPVESLEDIWLIFQKLLGLILPDLVSRNHAVRQLRLILKPDRGWGRPTVERTISLSRPHRDRAALLDLIRCETERIDCEHGFVRFRLEVPLHEPVLDAQTQLFEQEAAEEQIELERLFQRLRVRMGEAAVVQPELVESYLPERAWRPTHCDAIFHSRERKLAGLRPRGLPSAAKKDSLVFTSHVPPPRPLCLLKIPTEIAVICEPSDDRTGQPRQFTWLGNVHRLSHIIGPERVAGEWWRGHYPTRDYYNVEDEAGRRFWIFRVLQLQAENRLVARWFLHGRFD
jgi:protein ImuB